MHQNLLKLIATLAVMVGLVGCGPELETQSDSDSLGAAQFPLTINGMTATWQYVGYPWAANQIAACPDGTVYALNDDYHLYKGDGTDSKWVYKGYPSQARDIACTSGTWIWALNADKKFYYNVSSGVDSGWYYEGTASGAIQIGNGNLLSALNANGSVWTYDNYTKVWSYKASFPGATQASSAAIPFSGKLRWFVVENGTVQFTDGSSAAVTSFPIPGGLIGTSLPVRDVSAVSSDVVWALTESRKLYKATFKEIACKDGKDNDLDGRTDGYDYDCLAPLGTEVCAKFNKTGTYCISRLGLGSNAVARCNGSTLVGTSVGDWCTQVGAGGSDYVGIVQ